MPLCRWDEEVFGLEYDLDLFNIVAVDDFNMGEQGKGGARRDYYKRLNEEFDPRFFCSEGARTICLAILVSCSWQQALCCNAVPHPP
jgi:hypothetical protein